MPLWLVPLIALLSALPGIVLLCLSVLVLLGLLQALLTKQQVLFQFLLVGLFLGFLWWLYMQLPGFLRRALSKLLRGRERNDHGH